MKRFKFRLQTVLEQRERAEQNAIQSYAQAKQAVVEAQSILDDLTALRQELIDGLSLLRTTGQIDPQEQLVYQQYIRQVTDDMTRQTKRLGDLVHLGERMRLQLVDASQDKKVVDKLRAKVFEAHAKEVQRIEQNEVDEMATQRHHMQKLGRAA